MQGNVTVRDALKTYNQGTFAAHEQECPTSSILSCGVVRLLRQPWQGASSSCCGPSMLAAVYDDILVRFAVRRVMARTCIVVHAARRVI